MKWVTLIKDFKEKVGLTQPSPSAPAASSSSFSSSSSSGDINSSSAWQTSGSSSARFNSFFLFLFKSHFSTLTSVIIQEMKMAILLFKWDLLSIALIICF